MSSFLLLTLSIPIAAGLAEQCYRVKQVRVYPEPVLSFLGGNSEYGQVFNPTWIEASPDGKVKPGLLVRTQDCVVGYAPNGCGLQVPGMPSEHACCGCNMRNASDDTRKRSILTFSALEGSDGWDVDPPRFAPVRKPGSVVFEPVDKPPKNDDFRGTEDPRIALDRATGIYYMFYTCYAKAHGPTLCLASTTDPTSPDGWTRHGTAFPGEYKSGALLIRDEPPHFLIQGAGSIHISNSTDLLKWERGPLFINETAWGNPHVEAGPPPMRMDDGNYMFFFNSWGGKGVPQPGYQPAWAVLDGKDPTRILASATEPLWSPNDYPWMAGNTTNGTQCNVPQVAFLEAAHRIEGADAVDGEERFRVYYGGSDAVLGTAVVSIQRVPGVKCV